MKLDTEALPGSKVKVVFTAEADDMTKVFDKTYDRIRQEGRMPGFRPGKAPNTIIKRHYSEELIREMAWSAFLEDIYLPGLQNSDLRLVFHPEIPQLDDTADFAEGQPLQIETIVTVHPQPELPAYKSLPLIKARPEVTDEEVEEQLEQLRESYADELEVDRDAVAESDLVRVSMKVLAPDGEVIEETTSEFIAARESDQPVARQLTGHVIGQVVTDETTISEDFDDERLAGQKVTIEATIESLKERKLPELDDDFAQDVDEQLESLEALRARIREQLEATKRRAAERGLRNMAVTLVMQATAIDLPQELVGNVTASQVDSHMRYLRGRGLSAADSIEAVHSEQDTVQSQVVDGLKLHYIFDAIAENEDIQITDDDVEAAIPQYAEENSLDEQMVRDAAEAHEETENQLRNFVLHNRVVQILVENAEIEEVPWEAYSLRARRHMEEYVEELRGTGSAAPALEKSDTAASDQASGTEPGDAAADTEAEED